MCLAASVCPLSVALWKPAFARIPVDHLDFDAAECFATEAGSASPSKNSAFAIGVLAVDDAVAHVNALQSLRQENNFKRRLRWGKPDERKHKYALAAIDHFFSQNLFFLARVTSSQNWPKRKRDREIKYKGYYRETLYKLVTPDLDLSLSIASQRSTSYSTDPVQDVAERMNEFEKIALRRMRDDDLLQLSGFFTSCALADYAWKRDDAESSNQKTSKEKRSYVERLKEHLEVQSLDDPELRAHKKFRVEVVV